MRLGSSNPLLRHNRYERSYAENSATYTGVTLKTGLLFAIIMFAALYTSRTLDFNNFDYSLIGYLIAAPIVALIAAIVTHRIPQIGFITSIVYAVAEGAFLGVISTIYTLIYGDQIVEVALLSTFGVLGAMLFLYATGIVRVGHFFRRLMYTILGGLLVTSLIILLLFVFGVGLEAFYTFYVAVVIISVIAASLFLLVDFDRISRFVEMGIDRHYEWSLSLGLVTTVVWLYVELLRLIAIFRD